MPVFLVLAARVSNVCVCILSNCQPFNSSQCPTENKETLGIHLRVVGDWTGGLTHTHTHTHREKSDTQFLFPIKADRMEAVLFCSLC